MNQAAVEEVSAQFQVENASAPETLITEHLDLWTGAIVSKGTSGRGSSQKYELYGIKKLRELILELAVRGKLTPQDPRDESASESLKRMAEERLRLIKEKKIRKPNPVPPIGEMEKPFSLPPGWEFVRWGDMAFWALGSGFPKSAQGESGGEVLFAKVSDMNLPGNERYIVATTNTVSYETASKIRAKVHARGAVVFPKIGGAIATNKRRIITRPTAFDNNCLGLIPSVGISTEYLFMLLTAVDLTAYQSGTSVPALSQSVLELIVSALPPLAEQHRIVAKVDELMTLCDQLENQTEQSLDAHATLADTLLDALTHAQSTAELAENWQRLETNWDILFPTTLAGERAIDKLKQTILQLAVMGKLVPQDPSDEPASELLKRIAAEKEQLIKDRKIKKQKPLPPITSHEELFQIPEGWEWVRFFDVNTVKSELVSAVDFPMAKQIAPDSIEKGTGRILCERTVSEIGAKGPNNRFYRGQILYSKIRPSLNKVVIAPYNGLCSADMYPVICHAHSAFMLQYMLSEPFLRQVRLAENRVKMPKLNLESLGQFLVALPPLEEQKRVVSYMEALMALCEQLKQRLQTAQKTQQKFTDAIVSTSLSEN